MSSYQAFPVYDYKAGLNYAHEPWLLPKDAFAELFNARLYQGKIQKRAGSTFFGDMPHQVRSEIIGTSGATNYTGTLANTPVRSGDPSSHFQFTDGTQVVTDNGDGTLGGDGSGTINYFTGDYDVTFNAATSAAVTADYQFLPGLPITGIFTYYSSTGSSSLLVFDTRRCAQYFPLQNKFHDIVEADTWTGGPNNFIWFENWSDNAFITNNLDRVKRFDGSSFTDLLIDIDGDGNNDVDTCLLIFSYKQRLVLLRTTESGSNKPQRARWCTAGDWSDWTNDGYVDAPTLDWIISAGFLGDDLVVFFERSIWKLQYTGDADLPFHWKKVVSTEGSYATYSMTSFSDELMVLGPTGLISTDGFSSKRLDDKISDIALEFDMENYGICYAAVLEELREDWLTYPQIGSTYADRILSLNYIDNSWSIYDLAIQCIGYWQQAEEPTWDQIDLTWDEMERTWDERSKQAGYPITLGGTSDGKILNVADGGSDQGSAINLEIKTGRLNPFWKQGRQARLGWVEMLVTVDPDTTLYIDFYADWDTDAYLTQTVQLDGNGEKVWKAVDCGETANIHQIVIRHAAANQSVEIHAIVYYFKPGGRLV